MGLLDTLLTASLTATMTSSMVTGSEKNTPINKCGDNQEDKVIFLSSESSYLDGLNISSIRLDKFDTYESNILQISKESYGTNNDFPLFFVECIPLNEKINEIKIVPNISCYQKQFVNSKFVALTGNEIVKFSENNNKYKLLKIHTEPIGDFYLCEAALLN